MTLPTVKIRPDKFNPDDAYKTMWQVRIDKLNTWIKELPTLHIPESEWKFIKEYSTTLPTGISAGKRWKRKHGAFDQEFKAMGWKPKWVIGQFDPAWDGGKHVNILWYRPIIIAGK